EKFEPILNGGGEKQQGSPNADRHGERNASFVRFRGSKRPTAVPISTGVSVIASVATPEPRRRRPQANVTPIPNRCQLEPIASPCRFEHFQTLARSTRGNRASR